MTAEGWRIVADPPVRFRRAKAMLPLPLPLPVRGGSLTELRAFLNVTDDWPLVLGWLVAAFRPTGPYAVLKLLADQGSGKSTAARVLRGLIDPNTASARSAPKSERDLMIAASNGWVASFDNLNYVAGDLSDALCRLSTGSGWATRTLYENDEETIFAAARPILLNSIEEVGTRSDLLDRSLIVTLPRIEAGARWAEKEFWAAFEKARPKILGAMLDAVAAALKNLPDVEARGVEWPRIADFAQWATAAEPALGSQPGEFLAAYEANRETASRVSLESSPVYAPLMSMLRKGGSFEGTATELLSAISVGGVDTKAKGWPKDAKTLSAMLSRLAPNLRSAGLVIEQSNIGSGNAKRKGWRIEAGEADLPPVKPPLPLKPSSAASAASRETCGLAAYLRKSTGRTG